MDNRNTAGETVAAISPSAGDETVIVSVGAEGGGVMLLGRRGMEGSWEFRRVDFGIRGSDWAAVFSVLKPI